MSRERMREHEAVQAKPTTRPLPVAPSLVHQIEAIRQPATGHSLDAVRVHRGPSVDRVADSLQAEAFTVGKDVFMGAGASRSTLSHELAHTRQQAPRSSLGGLSVVPNASPLEQSVSANPLRVSSGPPLLFRKPKGNPSVLPGQAPPAPGKAPTGKGAGDGKQAVPPKKKKEGGASSREPAQAEKPLDPGAKAEAPPKPVGPETDPNFRKVAGRAHSTAKGQTENPGGAAVAHDGQKAAVSPANERDSLAQADHVDSLAQEEPKAFDTEKFKKDLKAKIDELTPKSEAEADGFMKDPNANEQLRKDLNTKVGAEQKNASGNIPEAVKESPNPASVPARTADPLKPPQAGGAPSSIGAGSAMPSPRPDSDFDMSAQPKAFDAKLSGAKVTEDQLKKSNEPKFVAAADGVGQVKAHAEAAPLALRESETAKLAESRQGAAGTGQLALQGMFGSRTGQFDKATTDQAATKSKDEAERKKVADTINKEYEATKKDVDTALTGLDTSVGDYFDRTAESHRDQFKGDLETGIKLWKAERYGEPNIAVGLALATKDVIVGLPEEVKVVYEACRKKYLERMETLIDDVAKRVEKALTTATNRIKKGKATIDTYVSGLPKTLKEFGQEAAAEIGAKFDDLTQQVTDKRDQLIDRLAAKYVLTLQEVDGFIAEKKKENEGLAAAVVEAVDGALDTIAKLRDTLLNVLSRAASAIDLILEDPIKFVGNLVSAVKSGLNKFLGNIGKHLLNGLMGWLFGALAEAGIELPQNFDLKGVLSLILQVLGLTYKNIRARAVRILGEKIVSALETAAEVFIVLINEGPAGLIKFLQDKVEAMKETMMEQIKTFVAEKILIAGVKWIIGLMNPAGAFIKACMAIYDIIMFFVNNGARIMSLVNAVIDSVTNIARGNISGAAAWIENALATSVPIAISFLASLLGLDGIGQKIKSIIEKIQAPINAAIDWLIKGAVKLVKAAGKLLGFGKEKTPVKKDLDDPQGVKAIAQQRISEREDSLDGVAAWNAFLNDIYRDLKPQGLKSLQLEASEGGDDEELPPVTAEASKKETIATMPAKDITPEAFLAESSEAKREIAWKRLGRKHGGKPIYGRTKNLISEKVGEDEMVKHLKSNGYNAIFSPKQASGLPQGFDAVYQKPNVAVVVCEAKGKHHRGDPTSDTVTAKPVTSWPANLLGYAYPDAAQPKGYQQGTVGWARRAGEMMAASSSSNKREKDAAAAVKAASFTPGPKQLELRTLVFLAKHRYGKVVKTYYEWWRTGP